MCRQEALDLPDVGFVLPARCRGHHAEKLHKRLYILSAGVGEERGTLWPIGGGGSFEAGQFHVWSVIRADFSLSVPQRGVLVCAILA